MQGGPGPRTQEEYRVAHVSDRAVDRAADPLGAGFRYYRAMADTPSEPGTGAPSGRDADDRPAVTGSAAGRSPAGRLPFSTLVAYAPPIVGITLLVFYIQLFFFKFATEVLGIAGAIVGLIFGLGRLWDAVADLLVGVWSDRTRTRLGRRRPWMLAGAPLMALSFVMVWSPPESLSPGAATAWSAVALFLFFSGFTFYLIPHQALGAELSDDYHERSRIFGTRQVFFLCGMALAMVFMHVTTNAENTRETAGSIALLMAAIGMTILLITPGLVRERPEFQGRGAAKPWRALGDVVVRNAHARRILVVIFIDTCAVGMLSVLAPFLAEYVMLRPDLQAALPGVFMLASLLSVPLWVALSKRIGKRDAWRVSMVMAALAFGGVVFTGPGREIVTMILLAFAGAGYGCGGALGPSLLADVIDYDEFRTHQRQEGAYSAAWGFCIKSGLGVTALLAGVMLDLSGFVPNQAQSEHTLWMLKGVFSGFPFALFLFGAWFFKDFALSKEEHGKIREALHRRSEARESAEG